MRKPASKWCVGELHEGNKHCAFGHLVEQYYSENENGKNLDAIFSSNGMNVSDVNDGNDSRFTQKTPRARILAALNRIISKGKSK